jgi:hypothetical protein
MKFSEAIIKYVGEDVPSDETINVKFTALLGEHESLKTEKEGLEQELEQLKLDKAELEAKMPMAEAGEKYLSDQRQEAVKWYKLLKQDNASDEMIKIYESAKLDEIKIIVLELQKEVEEKIPGSCPHCGKQVQKLNRRSSKELSTEQAEMLDRKSFQTS